MTTAHDIAAQHEKLRRAYDAYVAAVTELDDAVTSIADPDAPEHVEGAIDRVVERLEMLGARDAYALTGLDRAVAALTDVVEVLDAGA